MSLQAPSLSLDESQRRYLLHIARESLAAFLQERPFTPPPPDDPNLWQQVGIFVTLWQQDGREPPPHWPHGYLRGCIGHVQSELPMYEAVAKTAVEAATNDPRFPALTSPEFEQICFEISLLSPLTPVNSLDEIEIGKHGLLITNGVMRGLLLPQVAVNRNWNREEFVTAVSRKANLPHDIWPQGAKLYSFTSLEFVESE